MSHRRRALRIGGYVLAGFVIGSLILGTAKRNAFVDNVVYGLWTGALTGVAVGLAVYAAGARRVRQRGP